jgi:hypothetical protein
MLHIRNDIFGEDVTFGTLVGLLNGGTQADIGILQPGEFVSIEISNISGVYAKCAPGLDSVVACIITELPNDSNRISEEHIHARQSTASRGRRRRSIAPATPGESRFIAHQAILRLASLF